MAVLHFFPHRDIHLALNTPAAKSIPFRIFEYLGAGPFTLSPLDTPGEWTAQVLAPHNAVGTRLQSFVNIDFAARKITATGLGTNLVILHHKKGTENDYLVIRIQVHDTALGWWFGNKSVTCPLDTQFANTQPSIYAMFSDDAATGTDRVGDITGHGFVTLTPGPAAKFVIDNTNKAGRLRGTAEGASKLRGAFLGVNAEIDVNVVDYGKRRDILVPVRASDLANAANRHNILFLAEGFTAAEEAKFDRIVTTVADELFSKPRHQPYGILSESFNVFKAFVPSHDRGLTCGFQVTDTEVPALGKGKPIPLQKRVSDDDSMYEVSQLVQRVGLPKRGETRTRNQLVDDLWTKQGLHDFVPAKVNDALVEAWKNSHSLGYLEARDTFFGLMLGGRRGDIVSTEAAPIPPPAADDGSPALKALVRRAYEFYRIDSNHRHLSFDTRKHAPQRMLEGDQSRASVFMNFLRGLRMKSPPNQPLGTEWVPDGTFKRSRGLIAIISNEHMHGGTNMNDNTVTANTINRDSALEASYVANANANIKVMRRDVPVEIEPNLTGAVNTIAHEFGHSFNLGDEYEDFPEPPNFASEELNPASRPADRVGNGFDGFDNIASLEAVFNDPQYIANNSRTIDPAKFKWFRLPRIKLSSRMTAVTQVSGGKITVTIAAAEAAAWEAIKTSGEEVHLRRIVVAPDGKQLPLSVTDADHLTGLVVHSVDAVAGKVVLKSTMPFSVPPNFPAGSMLFLPHRTAGVVQTIIEPKVLAELTSSHKPLNSDVGKPDATSKENREADFPRDIPNFKPPCQSSRLLGAFEGGATWAGLIYRPSGTCKMRTSQGNEEHGEFCHVCKWLITNRVDPGKHHLVDSKYYPKAKKNE